jgi:hypothetical protein
MGQKILARLFAKYKALEDDKQNILTKLECFHIFAMCGMLTNFPCHKTHTFFASFFVK